MKKSIGSNASLVGILIISFTFFSLFLAPQFLTKRHFSFPVPAEFQRTEIPDFALDTHLKIIHGQAILKPFQITKPKGTLREILKSIGRPTLINFWATWCPPCIEEFPSVEYLNRQLANPNAKLPFLLTVTVDEAENDVRKFFGSLSFTPSIVVLHDLNGDVSRAFGSVKFPETYLVTAGGKTLHKWVGPQNWLSRDVIEKLSELQ